MARNHRNGKNRSWMIYVAIAVMATVATWQFWPGPKGQDTGDPPSKPDANNVRQVNRTVRTDNTTTRPDAESTAKALKKYNAGNAAFEAQKHLEARRLLSEVVFAGGLSGKLANDARSKLSYLAEATLFAKTIDPRDPYTMRYKFKTGDLPATVERQQRLHVPSQLLVKINRVPGAGNFRAGVDYKLIKGPFHAVVYKSIFKMDLYLYRDEDKLPPVFVKRYDVGLGKNNSTPIGKWRLGCGALPGANGKPERGKLLKAAWNPPNSPRKLRIEYSMPGYPFGRKGMWISLVGLDENTKKMTDYGIHSTNDPSSIGKQASMGCIRMRDADIQEVYDRLYEKWSTVRILP